MPTKGVSYFDDPLPLFLADQSDFLADESEHQGLGEAWDRAVSSSRVLKASIALALATAIGIAILLLGNPVTLFADVTASVPDVTTSLVGKSTLPPGSEPSTPTIQSIAEAEPLPPTANDAPTRDEIAAASAPATQTQTETSVPASEALFRESQAWLADQDAQAKAAPIQPVADASAQLAENARASLRPMQKHRQVRTVQTEQADLGAVNNPRKKVRREQNARVQIQPAQTAQAQDQSAQNAQAPSLLQMFGWRN